MTPNIKRYLRRRTSIELLEFRNYIDKLIGLKSDAKATFNIKSNQTQAVLKELAYHWGVPSETAVTKRRFSEAMLYKHAIRFAIRTVTGMPLQNIGNMLNCDHATVMHSIKFVNDCQVGDLQFYVKCIDLASHLRIVLTELQLNENQSNLQEFENYIYN